MDTQGMVIVVGDIDCGAFLSWLREYLWAVAADNQEKVGALFLHPRDGAMTTSTEFHGVAITVRNLGPGVQMTLTPGRRADLGLAGLASAVRQRWPRARVNGDEVKDSGHFARPRGKRKATVESYYQERAAGRVGNMDGFAAYHGISGRTLRRWIKEYPQDV